MEIFRKGGEGWGGLDPIPNFGTHFFCTKVLVKRGGGHNFGILLTKISFKYGPLCVFLEGFVFPIFCYQDQMCTTGSITSENQGGRCQTPYGRFA